MLEPGTLEVLPDMSDDMLEVLPMLGIFLALTATAPSPSRKMTTPVTTLFQMVDVVAEPVTHGTMMVQTPMIAAIQLSP
jgi:hypothetical protein